MNMLSIIHAKVDANFLNLRKQQESLFSGPIDMYWLNKASLSIPFIIHHEEREVGYVLVSQEGVLYEYFLRKNNMFECFREIAMKLDVQSAIVSARNTFLFEYCMQYFPHQENVGYLFEQQEAMPCERDFDIQLATEHDLDYLLKNDTSPHLSRARIQEKALFIGRVGGSRIGYGKIAANFLQPQYADIGVLVEPVFRGKGFGTQLMYFLAQACRARNVIPSCGCDVENIVSKKMIEKAGFSITGYMVRFYF